MIGGLCINENNNGNQKRTNSLARPALFMSIVEVGRGSAHVVFASGHPTGTTRVLRASLHSRERTLSAASRTKNHIDAIRQHIGHSIPSVELCELSEEVVGLLSSQPAPRPTLQPAPRPPAKSTPVSIEHPESCTGKAFGLEMPNLMSIWQPLPPAVELSRGSVVTVEIKPKAAAHLAARSYLVGCYDGQFSRINDIKFSSTRFQMTQVHKSAKRGGAGASSKFQPARFFAGAAAGDQAEVAASLRAAIIVPENNLRVFIDGKALAWGDPASASNADSAVAAALQGMAPGTGALSWVVEQAAEALVRPCGRATLTGLRSLQDCDIVDVEGAHLALKWLANLMMIEAGPTDGGGGGSSNGLEAALGKVDQLLAGLGDGVSHFGLPPPPSALDIESLAFAGANIPGDEPRRSALEYLKTLDAEKLATLIANHLLALAAADASLMISFAVGSCHGPLSIPEVAGDRPGHASILHSSRLKSAAGEAEVLVCCVGLVDVGPKPASKVISRGQKESQFCSLAAERLVTEDLQGFRATSEGPDGKGLR